MQDGRERETPAELATRAPRRYERLIAAVTEIAGRGDDVGLWEVVEAWFFADRPRPAKMTLEVVLAIASATPLDELEDLATEAERQLAVTRRTAEEG
jgi:hypothetical protein